MPNPHIWLVSGSYQKVSQLKEDLQLPLGIFPLSESFSSRKIKCVKNSTYTKFTGCLPSQSSLIKGKYKKSIMSKILKGLGKEKLWRNKLAALYTMELLSWKSSLSKIQYLKVSLFTNNYWLYTFNFYFTWNILTNNKQNYRIVSEEYIDDK